MHEACCRSRAQGMLQVTRTRHAAGHAHKVCWRSRAQGMLEVTRTRHAAGHAHKACCRSRAQGMLQVTRTGLSGHIVTPHTAQVDAHSIVV